MTGYITEYQNVGVYAEVTDRCCDGGIILNRKISLPNTGDNSNIVVWIGVLTVTMGAIAVICLKKKKSSGKFEI